MILARHVVLLLLAAFAAFAAASDAAASGAPHRKTSRAMKQWHDKKQQAVAELVRKTKAEAHTSQLRATATATATVAADSNAYQSGIAYSWPTGQCTGDSWEAFYFGSTCAKFEEGMSARYNCVINGGVGEIQAHGFANGGCSGSPAVVISIGEFVAGECEDGFRVECSADLKYGMDDAVVYGSYASSKCKSDSLFEANLYPYGCDGYGYKETCVGGELVSQVYPTDDCSGTPGWEARSSVGVCELYDDADADDMLPETTSYTMNHCSASDVDFTGSSDSASIAGFSWAAILMTAFAAFAMRA